MNTIYCKAIWSHPHFQITWPQTKHFMVLCSNMARKDSIYANWTRYIIIIANFRYIFSWYIFALHSLPSLVSWISYLTRRNSKEKCPWSLPERNNCDCHANTSGALIASTNSRWMFKFKFTYINAYNIVQKNAVNYVYLCVIDKKSN